MGLQSVAQPTDSGVVHQGTIQAEMCCCRGGRAASHPGRVTVRLHAASSFEVARIRQVNGFHRLFGELDLVELFCGMVVVVDRVLVVVVVVVVVVLVLVVLLVGQGGGSPRCGGLWVLNLAFVRFGALAGHGPTPHQGSGGGSARIVPFALGRMLLLVVVGVVG